MKKTFKILIYVLFQVILCRLAYLERGYVAFGGEWLLLPLLYLGKVNVKELVNEKGEIRLFA